MDRRSLLRLIGAAPLAASKLSSASFVSAGKNISGAVETASGVGPVSLGCDVDALDAVMQVYWQVEEAKSDATYRMPPHIASKKSWSVSFKHSEAVREAIELKEIEREMRRNRKFAEAVARHLGVWNG